MNGFTGDNIFMLLIGVGLLILAIKFLKGLLKTIIAILLIITVGFSCYNIFVAKKSISYEINRYKTDFAYAMEIKNISNEASKVINSIKKNIAMEEGIDQLVDLRNKANQIPHSEEAHFFHDKYIAGFDSIILACKGYTLGEMAEEQVSDLEELTKGINFKIMDVLKNN